jgi:hypothetical protein
MHKAVWLMLLVVSAASADDFLRETPEGVYHRFMELLNSGDIASARKLTSRGVRIVSEESVSENAPNLNVRMFAGRKSVDPVLLKEELTENRCLLRTGSAWFFLEKRRGRWVIVKAGLKPID